MADDLRGAIEDAITEDTKDEVVVAAPVVDTPVVDDTPTTETTETVPAEETPSPAIKDEPPAEVAVVEEKPAIPSAPASWKGEAKQVWADLPEQARNEVIRREGQVNRVLAETAEVRQFAGSINEVTQRHSQRLSEFNLPPAQVFETLLEADRVLSSAEPIQRAQYMAKLIKDYGVDIQALDNALSGAVPAIPDVSRQVQMQVDAALAPFRQREQQQAAAQQQEIADTIEMMTDNPDYPLFDDVRDEMADLIEIKANRGVYIGLEQAYATITGGSPVAQQQQHVVAVKQNNVTALKAKAAAVSVSGTPASSNSGVDPRDLRATIGSILDGIR